MQEIVLIAEDDPVYRSFISEAIRQSSLSSAELLQAGDGLKAVELAKSHHVGSVILDLQMPHLSGVDAARQIWARDPTTRILFWSNFADEAYVRSLSRIVPAEASYGYLLKSTAPDRLRMAIEGVFLDGQCIIDREIRGIQARTEKAHEALNDIEYDMLIDIALGFTDQAMATRHGLSTRGVQSRLQKLYAKLGVGIDDMGGNAVYNPRTRAICVAVLGGVINADLLERAWKQDARSERD